MSMLAERKVKQKWCLNPRGNQWSSDQNKFGQKMLEKLGWKNGSGLGPRQDGIKEHVKVSYKNDSKGMGFKESDTQWTEHEDEFTKLLSGLQNTEGFSVPKQSDKPTSLVQKSAESKARLHYRKFTRGKDLSRYSEKDLANVFGRKKLRKDPKEAEANDVAEAEELKYGVQTIKGGSMVDYFKRKLPFGENRAGYTVSGNGKKEAESDGERPSFGFGFGHADTKFQNGNDSKPACTGLGFVKKSTDHEDENNATQNGFLNSKDNEDTNSNSHKSQSQGLGFVKSKDNEDATNKLHGLDFVKSKNNKNKSQGLGFIKSKDNEDDTNTSHGLGFIKSKDNENDTNTSHGLGFIKSKDNEEATSKLHGLGFVKSKNSTSKSHGLGFIKTKDNENDTNTSHGLGFVKSKDNEDDTNKSNGLGFVKSKDKQKFKKPQSPVSPVDNEVNAQTLISTYNFGFVKSGAKIESGEDMDDYNKTSYGLGFVKSKGGHKKTRDVDKYCKSAYGSGFVKSNDTTGAEASKRKTLPYGISYAKCENGDAVINESNETECSGLTVEDRNGEGAGSKKKKKRKSLTHENCTDFAADNNTAQDIPQIEATNYTDATVKKKRKSNSKQVQNEEITDTAMGNQAAQNNLETEDTIISTNTTTKKKKKAQNNLELKEATSSVDVRKKRKRRSMEQENLELKEATSCTDVRKKRKRRSKEPPTENLGFPEEMNRSMNSSELIEEFVSPNSVNQSSKKKMRSKELPSEEDNGNLGFPEENTAPIEEFVSLYSANQSSKKKKKRSKELPTEEDYGDLGFPEKITEPTEEFASPDSAKQSTKQKKKKDRHSQIGIGNDDPAKPASPTRKNVISENLGSPEVKNPASIEEFASPDSAKQSTKQKKKKDRHSQIGIGNDDPAKPASPTRKNTNLGALEVKNTASIEEFANPDSASQSSKKKKKKDRHSQGDDDRTKFASPTNKNAMNWSVDMPQDDVLSSTKKKKKSKKISERADGDFGGFVNCTDGASNLAGDANSADRSPTKKKKRRSASRGHQTEAHCEGLEILSTITDGPQKKAPSKASHISRLKEWEDAPSKRRSSSGIAEDVASILFPGLHSPEREASIVFTELENEAIRDAATSPYITPTKRAQRHEPSVGNELEISFGGSSASKAKSNKLRKVRKSCDLSFATVTAPSEGKSLPPNFPSIPDTSKEGGETTKAQDLFDTSSAINAVKELKTAVNSGVEIVTHVTIEASRAKGSASGFIVGGTGGVNVPSEIGNTSDDMEGISSERVKLKRRNSRNRQPPDTIEVLETSTPCTKDNQITVIEDYTLKESWITHKDLKSGGDLPAPEKQKKTKKNAVGAFISHFEDVPGAKKGGKKRKSTGEQEKKAAEEMGVTNPAFDSFDGDVTLDRLALSTIGEDTEDTEAITEGRSKNNAASPTKKKKKPKLTDNLGVANACFNEDDDGAAEETAVNPYEVKIKKKAKKKDKGCYDNPNFTDNIVEICNEADETPSKKRKTEPNQGIDNPAASIDLDAEIVEDMVLNTTTEPPVPKPAIAPKPMRTERHRQVRFNDVTEEFAIAPRGATSNNYVGDVNTLLTADRRQQHEHRRTPGAHDSHGLVNRAFRIDGPARAGWYNRDFETQQRGANVGVRNPGFNNFQEKASRLRGEVDQAQAQVENDLNEAKALVFVGAGGQGLDRSMRTEEGIRLSFRQARFNSNTPKWYRDESAAKKSYKHLIKGDVLVCFKNSNLHEIDGYAVTNN